MQEKLEKGISVWLNDVFAKYMMTNANILLIADSHLKIHYDLCSLTWIIV